VTDRYTQTQYTQAQQILDSSLFSEAERRRMLLELTTMSRLDARNWLAALAVEYRRRAPREDQEAA